MKTIDKNIVITAIAGLTIIEVVAMFMGINGTMRTIIFAMIAGLAGLTIPTPKFIKTN